MCLLGVLSGQGKTTVTIYLLLGVHIRVKVKQRLHCILHNSNIILKQTTTLPNIDTRFDLLPLTK